MGNETYDDEAIAAYYRDAEEVCEQLEQRLKLRKLRKEKFFVLWNPASDLPPKVQFDSLAAALKVAVPMAQREKQPFFVLAPVAVAEIEPTPVKVRRIRRKKR